MVSLEQTVRFLVPAARSGIDYNIRDDGAGDYLERWNRPEPQPTPAQIAAAMPAAQAAFDAAQTAKTQEAADRAEVRAQFAADRDKLTAIIDKASFTNAERDAAIKDLAQVQRRMLRALKSLT